MGSVVVRRVGVGSAVFFLGRLSFVMLTHGFQRGLQEGLQIQRAQVSLTVVPVQVERLPVTGTVTGGPLVEVLLVAEAAQLSGLLQRAAMSRLSGCAPASLKSKSAWNSDAASCGSFSFPVSAMVSPR